MPTGNKQAPEVPVPARPECRTLFVTGTDTGAGKTLLTALLVEFLQGKGQPVTALKPFCTGGARDARVLARVQRGARSLDQIAPFRFSAPVAPLAAARRERRTVQAARAIACVESLRPRSGWMLIEGCGGVMTPLAEDFCVLDWIAAIAAPVLLAARNRLGVINHVRLTVCALQSRRIPIASVLLMGCRRADASVQSNRRILQELLGPLTFLELPYLGPQALLPERLALNAKKVEKTLALALRSVSFPPACLGAVRAAAEKGLTG